MYKYEIQIEKNDYYLSFKLISINNDDFKLIKDIDNDQNKIDILKYYDSKYNLLNQKVYGFLVKLIEKSEYTLKSEIQDISKCLLLFLLTIYNEEFLKRVTYQELKNNIEKNQFNTEDLIDFDINEYNKLIKKYENAKLLANYDDISLITFTTGDYVKYTNNLVESMKKCNLLKKLKIYCIDSLAYNFFKVNKHVEAIEFYDTIKPGIKEYLKEDWNITVFNKIKCIYNELFLNEYILYIDSDIIIKKNNIIDYLHNQIINSDYDILFQQNIGEKLCSGFMYIRSNTKTIDLFNYKQIDRNTFICDEDYINKNKNKIKYRKLKRYYFPIEKYYRKYRENLPYYMVHFNSKTGIHKEKSIKELGYWYI